MIEREYLKLENTWKRKYWNTRKLTITYLVSCNCNVAILWTFCYWSLWPCNNKFCILYSVCRDLMMRVGIFSRLKKRSSKAMPYLKGKWRRSSSRKQWMFSQVSTNEELERGLSSPIFSPRSLALPRWYHKTSVCGVGGSKNLGTFYIDHIVNVVEKKKTRATEGTGWIRVLDGRKIQRNEGANQIWQTNPHWPIAPHALPLASSVQ